MFKTLIKQALKSVRRNKNTQGGFTLMELLVVIVILGFLIGMIAPRLASIIDDQVIDNICDSNNKGARQYIKMFFDKKGRLPGGVTNVVNNGTSGYEIPSVSNEDPSDSAEVLAKEFQDRNDIQIHILTANEAAELRGLGIAKVRDLNPDPADGHRTMEEVDIAAGVGVAMIGVGLDASQTEDQPLDVSTWTDASESGPDYPKGNPYWLGRIVFGLGEYSDLVKDGYVQNAALCPGGIQNSDNCSFNNYLMIVPRLETTVARFEDAVQDAEYQITAADESGAADPSGKQETFSFTAQESWEFDATCPEGHKWPDNENDFWVF